MDPGDQLYTLDELRCWKVENLRVLDDERSNEGGATVAMLHHFLFSFRCSLFWCKHKELCY